MSTLEKSVGIDDGSNSYNVVFERGFEHLANFHQTGSVSDISQCIEAFKLANDISPNDRPLLNMANALFRRFELTDDPHDLDAAIEAQQAGIALQSEPSGVSLNNLGNMLRFRFEHISHSERDLKEALQNFRNAMCTEARPNVLLGSARSCAELSSTNHGASSAIGAYKFAMDLIPRISTSGTQLLHRFSWIPNVRESVDGAVAAAIEVGDLELALEWFERGRCVVWGQILQMRTPLDNLRSVNPTLADAVNSVLQQISSAEVVIEALRGKSILTPGRDEALKQGRDLVSRLDELIQEVRCLNGFEDFMKPRTTNELRSATAHSAIVALNISPTRCDALILLQHSDSVIHVPLPGMTLDKATKMHLRFQEILRSYGVRTRAFMPWASRAGHGVDAVLSRLWLDIVEPVLTKIGYLDPKVTSQLPRITWCPSGPLCFLPLHAAGIYVNSQRADPVNSKVFDFVISSYAPSISALVNVVRKRHELPHNGPQILAISQPATPKLNPLPGTVNEIAAVQKVVGTEMLTWLNDTEATASSVFALMDKHPWIHFACHGVQDSDAPTQSAFMLYDGGLDFRTIMKLSLDHKELAILSACQTAMGDSDFPEEAVSLAAGMLMAGYRNVVGTMWSIGDKDAPVVMEKLYSYLIEEGNGDSSGTAYALHKAVGYLRKAVGEENFVQWVPFIHIGA